MKETKTMYSIRKRIEKETEKKANYIATHSIHAAKSKYIGCPSCGSSLNRSMFKGEKCPLCHTELRSATTLHTISGYDKNISKWKKQYEDCRVTHERQVEKSRPVCYRFMGGKGKEGYKNLSKKEIVDFLKKTKKPIKYTYGLEYRRPTICKEPVSKKEAVKAFLKHWSDVTEYDEYVYIQSYSANDMW